MGPEIMPDNDWSIFGDLARKARAGDTGAFDELFTRMWDVAFGYVMKHYGGTLTPEDARDVVQHAFVTAWQKLPTLKNANAFQCWFYRILARKSIAACRLATVRTVLAGDDGVNLNDLVLLTPEIVEELAASVSMQGPYRQLVRVELVRESKISIAKVYNKLSPKSKAVFVARIINLFNEREIATITGLPIGTIRSATLTIVTRLQIEFGSRRFRDATISERRLAFVEALATWHNCLPEGAS